MLIRMERLYMNPNEQVRRFGVKKEYFSPKRKKDRSVAVCSVHNALTFSLIYHQHHTNAPKSHSLFHLTLHY